MRENSLLTLKEGLDQAIFVPGGSMAKIQQSIIAQSHDSAAGVEYRQAPISEKNYHLLMLDDFLGANGIFCKEDVKKMNLFLSSVNGFVQELGVANDKYVFFVRGSCVVKSFFNQDTDIALRNEKIKTFLSTKATENDLSWFSGPNIDLYIELGYEDYADNQGEIVDFIKRAFKVLKTTELPNGVTIVFIDGFEVPFNIVIRHNTDHKLEWKQSGDRWKETSNPDNARDSVSTRLDNSTAELKIIEGGWQVALQVIDRIGIEFAADTIYPNDAANFMRILRFNLIWPVKKEFNFSYVNSKKKEVDLGQKDDFIANLLAALFIDIRGVKDFFDLIRELKEFLPLLNFEQLTASIIDELDQLRDDLEAYLSLLVTTMMVSKVDDVKNTNVKNSFLQLIDVLNAVDENQTVLVAPKSII